MSSGDFDDTLSEISLVSFLGSLQDLSDSMSFESVSSEGFLLESADGLLLTFDRSRAPF